MDVLVGIGRHLAPYAIEATVTISLAALAGLLAARFLGPRQPSRGFAAIAAAFGLAVLLVLGLGPAGRESDPPPVPAAGAVAEPIPGMAAGFAPGLAPPLPGPAPARTATPGLSGRYGSLFQILIHRPADGADPPRAAGFPWLEALGLAWLAGVLALGLHHLASLLAAQRLLARSRPCRDPVLLRAAESARILLDGRPVELRLLPGVRGACVAGLLRPRILLPAEASRWSRSRLASTLLHEHGHAQRLDLPVTEGLRLLAILAWASPLPWRALALAQRLREQACDQAVVRAGVARTAYATDLLEAARSPAQPVLTPAAAPLATRGSPLEGRIRAILDAGDARSGWDHPLRTAAAAILVAAAGGAARLAAPLWRIPAYPAHSSLPKGEGEWLAGADPEPGGRSTARGAFSLATRNGYARIRLRYGGRVHTFQVPAIALPERLPLGSRGRMMVPFGDLLDGPSCRPFFHPGWSLWEGRQTPVVAAASGRVVAQRCEPWTGPVIELAHGDGLRTRYGLGPEGRSRVQVGEHVLAGTPIGIPGARSPYDLPALHFSILVQVDQDRVALDPTPFLLAAADNRRTPMGAGVLNAAIRLEDPDGVRRLLACGVRPDQPAADGTLPLEWALLFRNLPIARDLLAAGADPQAPTWDVHQAFIAWHGPTVEQLARDSGDPVMEALMVSSKGAPGAGAGPGPRTGMAGLWREPGGPGPSGTP